MLAFCKKQEQKEGKERSFVSGGSRSHQPGSATQTRLSMSAPIGWALEPHRRQGWVQSPSPPISSPRTFCNTFIYNKLMSTQPGDRTPWEWAWNIFSC